MATKPSGRPETSSSAATTPIRPSGTTLSTRNRRWKLRSWTIRKLSMMKNISGTTAITDARDVALSSAMPPSAIS